MSGWWRSTRTWRKLHLAVDPSTGGILASELTSNEDDASQVSSLLGQIPSPLASVTVDGAYDGEPVYRAVSERQPDPPVAVAIPPRSTAVPSAAAGTTPSQRARRPAQRTETKVACSVLNRVTRLGMPVSQRVR